jgi:hypothetical protein
MKGIKEGNMDKIYLLAKKWGDPIIYGFFTNIKKAQDSRIKLRNKGIYVDVIVREMNKVGRVI